MMRTVESGFQIAERALEMRGDLMGSLGGTDHSHSMCVTHQGLVTMPVRNRCSRCQAVVSLPIPSCRWSWAALIPGVCVATR